MFNLKEAPLQPHEAALGKLVSFEKKQCLTLYSQPQAVLKPFIYKACSQISQCTIFSLRICRVNYFSSSLVCLQVLLSGY